MHIAGSDGTRATNVDFEIVPADGHQSYQLEEAETSVRRRFWAALGQATAYQYLRICGAGTQSTMA